MVQTNRNQSQRFSTLNANKLKEPTMQITDYIIDIKDSSLADRLRLHQVLLDNNASIVGELLKNHIVTGITANFSSCNKEWTYVSENPNISLEDFINKFKQSNQIRNLAFYKKSEKPWRQSELIDITKYCGNYSPISSLEGNTSKFVFDDATSNLFMFDWSEKSPNFKNCLQVAYEDIFPVAENKLPTSNSSESKEKTMTFNIGDTIEYCGPTLSNFKPGQLLTIERIEHSHIEDTKYFVKEVSGTYIYLESMKPYTLNPFETQTSITKMTIDAGLTATKPALVSKETPMKSTMEINGDAVINDNLYVNKQSGKKAKKCIVLTDLQKAKKVTLEVEYFTSIGESHHTEQFTCKKKKALKLAEDVLFGPSSRGWTMWNKTDDTFTREKRQLEQI